jgi:hypothetical protein
VAGSPGIDPRYVDSYLGKMLKGMTYAE